MKMEDKKIIMVQVYLVRKFGTMIGSHEGLIGMGLIVAKESEKSRKKNKRVNGFSNAKKLRENNNRICQSAQKG